MTKEEAAERIGAAIEKVPSLREGSTGSPQHVAFVQTTGLDLERIFGPNSTVTSNFSAIRYRYVGTFLVNPLNIEHEEARRDHEAYLRGLNVAEGVLSSARDQLNDFGADDVLRATRRRSEGAPAFISHGTQGNALTKLERFVRTLGLVPVIVMYEPSEGLAVDDLVEKKMDESDCAIILATADEEVGGRRQPRPNVLHEIGLAQEKFDDKVIYLKEEGCVFPYNVAPKVWENFSQENMESAFEKVTKELRAFGLI